MFTHVCKIIWAQRKTNGWIFAELLLAMCAIWFLMDKVWVDQRCYHAPMGFDIQNCWRFRLGQLPEGVEITMESDGTEDPTTVMLTLMERIRQEPEVEEVCIAYFSMPYSQGDSWTSLFPVEGDTTGLMGESFHVLRVSPEYFDLFRARDEQGRSITQLLVSDPDARVLSGAAARRFFPGQSAVGKQVSTSRTLENPLRVVAVVPHFRSNDFDREEACYFQILQGDLLRECVETFGKSVELCVRMKRSMTAHQMMKFLSDASDRLQAGNLYVSGVKELSKQRAEILKNKLDMRKQQMAIILFLLVNVFFGVAGTFWLRTERRRGEIGLRLAMGSNRQQIGQVLYAEGLILLSLTLPFLLLLIFNLLKVDLLDTYREAYSLLRLLATVGASYLLMALMICLGIYYPARVAKRLPPAEALREE